MGQRSKPKLLVIVGPTAAGKSELAVTLAKTISRKKLGRFRGAEIISADSRQVYRGLNIGAAKVRGRWHPEKGVFLYRGIPHHLIDTIDPRKTYTAAEFQKESERLIQEITDRGNLPILAGGSAFWIDAAAYDLSLPAVAPNKILRTRLEKKTAAELLALLKTLDPRRGAAIEQKNPRRLIRAIEIARSLGRVPRIKKHSAYQTLWIGIRPDDQILAQRIKTRSRAMVRRGLVTEVKTLLEKKISKKRLCEFGFEYRLGLEVLAGTLSQKNLAQRLAAETLRYAKRQMRWWRRRHEIRWVQDPREALKILVHFLPENKF